LRGYADHPGQNRCYASTDRVPIGGVVPTDGQEAVVDEAGRVERIPYELFVLKALRDAIRRRQVWVAGGSRWRNREDDLPVDFEHNRDVHYGAIRRPLDPTEFIADLQARLREALGRLEAALAARSTGGGTIGTRRGEPA
jgi:hypothetical protein